MPDIASTDVTVTIVKRWIEGKHKYADVTIAFGDGSLTYPSGGVPMPAFGSFGLKRNIIDLVITDPASANGLVYKYDKTNNKVRIYEGDYAQSGDSSLVELDSGSDTPAAATLKGVARGW